MSARPQFLLGLEAVHGFADVYLDYYYYSRNLNLKLPRNLNPKLPRNLSLDLLSGELQSLFWCGHPIV